jgi:hypothetical protein
MSCSIATTFVVMLFNSKDSSKDTLYEPDDTIFRTTESKPLKLPEENSAVFEEVQPFNQVWLWALMGGEILLVLLPLVLLKMSLPIILWAALCMLIPLIILGSLKLKTRIDHEGVHFQMVPFQWKERSIPWTDIDQVYVRKYSPLREYGGWGIRLGRNGWAYNVRGNYGIQVVKKNGKQILLGTQQPDEVMHSLKTHPLLV